MIRKLDRKLVFGLIAIVAIVVLTLFVAPKSNRQLSGSTFSRSPDGYAAWYAHVQRQGVQIQPWKKPASEFTKQASGANQTFVQIDPLLTTRASGVDEDWIKRGNTWIILGLDMPPTEAAFTTVQAGGVKIETSRRLRLQNDLTPILSDRYGAIVGESLKGKGRIIYAVTPFLAANAYQNEPGNFSFLTKLATQNGDRIWVDEYLHGYKDQDVAQREAAQSWIGYLLDTPIVLILIQSAIVLLVLVWAKNRRFGQPAPLNQIIPDNSEAYIQALAGVLHKAGRSEFVLEVVGRETQLQIQRSLGLGSTLLDVDTIAQAWTKQTGRPAEELIRIFTPRQLSEADLLSWIRNVQAVRSASTDIL